MPWKLLILLGSSPGPKYCDRCGTANPSDAQYCQGCRQALPY